MEQRQAWRESQARRRAIPGVRALQAERRKLRVDAERATAVAWKKRPENWLRVLVTNARHRAKRDGIEFSIAASDLTVPEVCPVLGIPLRPGVAEGFAARAAAPSLDRIDPRRGYVPGNVQVISWRANRIKCDATLEELELLVQHMRRVS
jgi:hypothetical protein